jgi:hypothetical protein
MIVGSRKDGTRRSVSAHRLSYELTYGEIPDGMEVCHKCDNPCCVNPAHLFLGTRQDNIDDRERKGRNIVFIGEEQPRSKLTKKAVKDARWERAYKGTSYQILADRYGVSKKTMQNAIKGVTWKCVPYMPEPPKGELTNEYLPCNHYHRFGGHADHPGVPKPHPASQTTHSVQGTAWAIGKM